MPFVPIARVLTVLLVLTGAGAAAEPVRVGVSEEVYGDLARQIGGPLVAVTALRGNEAVPATSRPEIILSSGAERDGRLLETARRLSPAPVVIEASRRPDDAGFPWYDPGAMAALSKAFAAELSRRRPAEAPHVAANAAAAQTAFDLLDKKMREIADNYRASTILLADPLFLDIVERLRFTVVDRDELGSTRRSAAPARSSARIREAIERRRGSVFIYDRDAATADITALVSLANDSGVPAVGVQERLPKGLHYQQWMQRQLNALHGALNEASP